MSVYYPDLLWLVQNKDLISLEHNQSDLLRPNQAWLASISHDHLDSYMQSKNTHMLGPYYEALWGFYLTHYLGTQLIAQNIQINDNLKPKTPTIGEMDFIYRNEQSKQYVHLEVAIKFYLEVEQIDSTQPLSKWLGPKKNDRLDIKYNKLINHQTKLTQLDCTSNIIEPYIGSKSINAEAVLQGRLFERFNEKIDLTPFSLNTNVWFNLSEFKGWFANHQENICIQLVVKPHWLSMQHYQNTQDYPVLSLEEITIMVSAQNDAMPFVVSFDYKHPKHSRLFKKEANKRMIFIAPNNW